MTILPISLWFSFLDPTIDLSDPSTLRCNWCQTIKALCERNQGLTGAYLLFQMFSLVSSDTIDCGISHSTFSPQGDSTDRIAFEPIMLLVTRPLLILSRKGFRPQLEGLPPYHTPRKMWLHQLRYRQMYDIHVRQMGACCANLCMSPPSSE